MTDIKAELDSIRLRITRLEAALDEIAKGVSVYTNDKLYEERESKKGVPK